MRRLVVLLAAVALLPACASCGEPPCSANPCENGGACSEKGDGFECACAAGWAGATCARNVDDCAGSPCRNGGTCTDRVAGFECACAAGYSGATCDTDVDECAAAPCANGGTCTDRVAGFTCACPAGFAAPTCSACVEGHAGARCTRVNGGVVTTLAGIAWDADGIGLAASFVTPFGIAFDAQGTLWVADYDGARIRRITPEGAVTTFAGSGVPGSVDGTGEQAQFYWPQGVAADPAGNVYVAGNYDNKIRRISPAGVVSDFVGGGSGYADGTGAAAQFRDLRAVAMGPDGFLYAADQTSVRRVSLEGVVTTIAGSANHGSADGTGAAAGFYSLFAIAVDPAGNVYVADASNSRIRRVTPQGVVTSIGASAGMNFPRGVAVDAQGNVYAGEGYRIRRFSPGDYDTGVVLAGGTRGYADGTGTAAQFASPHHLALRGTDLFVADLGNRRIRKVDTATGVVTTAYGSGSPGHRDGVGALALFREPGGICRGPQGALYVADSGNDRLRKVAPDGTVTTVAGSGVSGHADGPAETAKFGDPKGIVADPAGNLFVADSSYSVLRKVAPDGTVSTLAGDRENSGFTDGAGTAARFDGPDGLALDAAGNLYVADCYNHSIRKVTPAGEVTTLAGDGTSGFRDGTGAAARFRLPRSLAFDPAGNLLVADSGNKRIRRIAPGGAVTTVAHLGESGWAPGDGGTGELSAAGEPSGVAVDASGNLYIGDTRESTVVRLAPEGGATVLAGAAGQRGSRDGTGAGARLRAPCALVLDDEVNLYLVDYGNHNVRVVR